MNADPYQTIPGKNLSMFSIHRKTLLTASVIAALALGWVLVLGAPATASNLNEAPIRSIAGAATNLDAPQGAAVAPDGTEWVSVTNEQATVGGLLAFAPGASGNAAPEADITGSNTGLESPEGVAIDSSGNIWVADPAAEAVYEFAAGANGNVAPIDTLAGPSTGILGVPSVAVGSDGTVYTLGFHSIIEFAGGASGNVAPTTVIAGPDTELSAGQFGLALAPDGSIVVSGYTDGEIDTFAAGASGDVAPVSVIKGSATQLVAFVPLAVDQSGNIYTIGSDRNSIIEFPADANGNIAPSISLTGTASELNVPVDVAIDSADHVWVVGNGATSTSGSLNEYDHPILSIASVSPASGPAVGGATVTLTGVGFTAGSTVTFGGVAAPNVDVVSGTEITVVVPPHAGGTVDVVVTPSAGCDCDPAAATLVASYTYAPALATTGVDPTPGIVAGIILFAIGAVLLLIRRQIVHRANTRN